MKTSRRAVRNSNDTLRSLQAGVWPAGWCPFGTPSDISSVFQTSVLTFESTFSATC